MHLVFGYKVFKYMLISNPSAARPKKLSVLQNPCFKLVDIRREHETIYKSVTPNCERPDVIQQHSPTFSSTGKLGFDLDIWNNKLKLSGYVEEAYLTTVPKVPKNPVAGFSKMAE